MKRLFKVAVNYLHKYKDVQDINYQIKRLAKRLKSWMNKFENCTGRATQEIQALALRGLCRFLTSAP